MVMLGLFLAGLSVGFNGFKSPMFYVGIAGLALISFGHVALN